MALFGWKKSDDTATKAGATAPPGNGKPPEDGAGGGGNHEFNGDKARKFFQHAKTVHETTNYEYAMQLWLSGLRFDPTNMEGLEGFFESAKFFASENKKGPSKDTLKQFGGRSDLDRYLYALLDWGSHPMDSVCVVRAAEYASRLGLAEVTYWIGERGLLILSKDPRPRKDLFLKMLEIFSRVNAFDLAVKAGETACRLDPLDGKLAADVRNLSAQATMSRGGYDKTGQAGGFRANIRDADRQRLMEESDRIVKTEETIDRLLKAAEDDYRSRPDDVAATNVYLKRLLERGRPEDEKRARAVAKEAFEKTKQYRFRQTEGEIVLRWAQRKVQEYKDKAEANPQDANAQAQYRQAQVQYTKMEIEELKGRVAAYPTDLGLKFELGRRYFDLERYDDALALFQEAKADAKGRVQALHYLGQCFQRIDWIDEAISTFRQAREAHSVPNDETALTLQYSLMTALQTKAEAERDLPAADEADRLASAIAIQQINYRDIRQRRDAIKKLLSELKRGDAAA